MSEHDKGPELTYGAHGQIIVDEDGDLRADLYNKLGVPSAQAIPETDALGRKMAAAPALVEALQAMLLVARLFNRRSDASWTALEDQALAALKKAGVEP